MWTYKTDDEEVVRITKDPERHNPAEGILYWNDDEVPHGIGESFEIVSGDSVNDVIFLTRIDIQEANKLRGIEGMQIDIRGNAPSKDLEMQNRQRKALEKNPMHTTMNDYKFGVKGSVPERAREKNLKRMRKKGVNVKNNRS